MGLAATGAVNATPCPSCGTLIAPGLAFCAACGTRTPQRQAGAGPTCRNCGTPAAAGAKFCGVCGTVMGSSRIERPVGAGPRGVALNIVDEGGTILGRHEITNDETTVGRGDATISFPDDLFLSPLHAKLTLKDGRLLLRDLGSRNNTWHFIEEPHRMVDSDVLLIGSQMIRFKRLGYPGPHPPEHDSTRRMGSLIPSADIARLTQVRADGSERDVCHLSPGRHLTIGREKGDWLFPFDPSMSSTHAQIRSEDADFVVVDAGSRNGVAVAVRGEIPLRNGSRMLVGDKLMRVEMA
ncbi:MAG: FHA domain-containing protein [Gemmatimonadetes bacterium]|nr:FHA domain-containing protein [Gemmatimonadota bacterium]